MTTSSIGLKKHKAEQLKRVIAEAQQQLQTNQKIIKATRAIEKDLQRSIKENAKVYGLKASDIDMADFYAAQSPELALRIVEKLAAAYENIEDDAEADGSTVSKSFALPDEGLTFALTIDRAVQILKDKTRNDAGSLQLGIYQNPHTGATVEKTRREPAILVDWCIEYGVSEVKDWWISEPKTKVSTRPTLKQAKERQAHAKAEKLLQKDIKIKAKEILENS